MEVKPLTVAEVEKFISQQPPQPGSFLQSPHWLGLIECSHGQAVEWLGLMESGQLVGLASAILVTPQPGYTYAYLPRGPLLLNWPQLEPAIKALKKYFQKRVFFLRVEPLIIGADKLLVDSPQAAKDLLRWAGFKRVFEVQPRATITIDLTKSDQEILAGMHQKTRYNIRLAERKAGLDFRWGDVEDFSDFWQLLKLTSVRGGWRTHAFTHYHSLLQTFGSKTIDPSRFGVHLGLASYNGELLAACFNVSYQGVMTYLHGASSRTHSELQAPYLLHWRAMMSAQTAGLKVYDFWGIDPGDASHPDWEGFTRFKIGFNKHKVIYPGTFDHPYSRLIYQAYKLGQFIHVTLAEIRKLLRRFGADRN